MTNWVELSGAQAQRFDEALLKVFSLADLERLLTYRLDKRLYNVVPQGPGEQVVFDLVRTAEQNGWVDDLLLTASEARPGHPVFEQLKIELDLGTSTRPDTRDALEAFVMGTGALLDPEILRGKLARAEAAVCRITYSLPGDGAIRGGTGFLVGPDLVLTNYHVMKHVIEGTVPPASVSVLFDYKVDAAGTPVNTGNPFALAANWEVDHSRYSDTDLKSLPVVPDTPADELDYALFRLAEPAGCEPIRSRVQGDGATGAAAGDGARGWLPIRADLPTVAKDTQLLILQHPQIGMMKLSWPPANVLAVNGSGTRVRHSSATLPGSSGSPCFDADFTVVALHHAGDPAETAEIPATYNQAIPLAAIVSLLTSRGLGGVLEETCGGA